MEQENKASFRLKWERWKPYSGIVKHICNNAFCKWTLKNAYSEDLEYIDTCPKCGDSVDKKLLFGGLSITYHVIRDNFTIAVPYSGGSESQILIDSADVPDAIDFMMRHYKFQRWRRVISEETPEGQS